jgi:hypothetical protein
MSPHLEREMATKLKDIICLKSATEEILPPAVEVEFKGGNQSDAVIRPKPMGNPNGRVRIDLAAGYTAHDVDELMHQVYAETKSDQQARLALMAQTIVEPILQIVPYAEMYSMFFMQQNYGDLEDNAIPIEDTVAMAWETHADGGTMWVRVGGMTWTRPEFQMWDYGIEVPWDAQRFVGWNFLARQMARCAEALARKRDAIAQYTLDAAITALSGHFPTVSGGVMTKASVDAAIKAQLQVGFPISRALVNQGVQTDMATWLPSTTLAQYPQNVGAEILTNLFISNYGGIQWMSNVYASSSFVYFSGEPNTVGWHQTKGSMRTVSDVDITNNRDLHKVIDAYHAWYVQSALSLRRLTILA